LVEAERVLVARASGGEVVSEVEGLRRRLSRLAFDVHDGPLQSLIAVGYGLHELGLTLAASAAEEQCAAAVHLDVLMSELASAEVALRSLITTLETDHLEIETIAEILSAELAAFRRRSPIPVKVSALDDFRPDSHSQALTIKSVLHEALGNIAKHACATEAVVRVEASEAGILLEVEDDGVGFDPEQVRRSALGLWSMRERVRLLDGQLGIRTRPGGPTRISAHLPRWHASGEEAVLPGLGRRLSYARIARELSNATGTVKFHLNRAHPKLGVATRLEALRVMVERALFGNPYNWL
jgi:signal transduction histidine kinase